MTYIAFAFWFLAIVLTARGVVSLWCALVGPKVVSWALLPGTIVSELAHFLACLITGASVGKAQLVPEDETKTRKRADSRGGVPILTALLSGMFPVAACLTLVALLCLVANHPVFRTFERSAVPAFSKSPAGLWTLWALLTTQVEHLADGCNAIQSTMNNWPWIAWHAWLLEYLVICLVLRIAPAQRPLRPALAGAAVLAGILIALAAILAGDHGLLQAWPLLTYTWTTILLLLAATLTIRGAVKLVMVLMGKQ